MELPDYYTLLEVPYKATMAQIKQSYRRLARLHHPDLNQEASDERIKQLNEAYAVLSDRARRAAYDIQRLEMARIALIHDMLYQQYQSAAKQPDITWMQGVKGFMNELKKEMRES
jgi:DnaJ-class molecular chaperone